MKLWCHGVGFWMSSTWVRIGSCKNEQSLGDYGDSTFFSTVPFDQESNNEKLLLNLSECLDFNLNNQKTSHFY